MWCIWITPFSLAWCLLLCPITSVGDHWISSYINWLITSPFVRKWRRILSEGFPGILSVRNPLTPHGKYKNQFSVKESIIVIVGDSNTYNNKANNNNNNNNNNNKNNNSNNDDYNNNVIGVPNIENWP